MKKINFIFAMAAMVAAFASCNKNSVAPQQENTLSLTAGTETKTLLRNGKEVRWAGTDELRVFDTENAGFTFKTTASDVKEAVFKCSNWTGTTPVMAVHSNSASFGGSSSRGSVITANLNPIQKIYHQKSYGKESALSVGKITENGGKYSIETMKNCFSLLQFTLLDTSVVSVTMTGNNEEIIAGWVDVDYDALSAGNPFWTANTTKGGSKSIAVNPEGGACKVNKNGAFADYTAYYISVLPQTLSKGLTLVMTRRDGKSATREIKSSVTFERGKIRSFEDAIDKDLKYKFGDIVLDCTDAAKFRYDNGGTLKALPWRNSTTPFDGDFWLPGNETYIFNGAARQWDNYLNASKGNSIKMPEISGYVLKEFFITSQRASTNRKYSITDGENTLSESTWTVGTTTEIKFDLSETTPGDRYIACDSELGIKFKLTYTAVSD